MLHFDQSAVVRISNNGNRVCVYQFPASADIGQNLVFYARQYSWSYAVRTVCTVSTYFFGGYRAHSYDILLCGMCTACVRHVYGMCVAMQLSRYYEKADELEETKDYNGQGPSLPDGTSRTIAQHQHQVSMR